MIVYASRTGNVRAIVQKLGLPAKDMSQISTVDEPFLLFTYTDGLGSIPPTVESFMESYYSFCKGIIVSGNRNFGHALFGRAGDLLAERYHLPLVDKLDLRGTAANYEVIQHFYHTIWKEGQS